MERNRLFGRNLLALLVVSVYAGYPATIFGQEATTFEEAYEALRAEMQQQEQPPLKRENPDQLYVDYSQSGVCPFTAQTIESMIEGLLVRSRLKPIDFSEWWSEDSTRFKLSIEVSCGVDDNPPHLFLVDTAFREEVTLQKPLGPIKVYMDHIAYYGQSGTYDPKKEPNIGFLRNCIRDSVEEALTDYLKANFD